MQSTNFTSLPNNSANLGATTAKLFLALSSSVLTLPKCENKTIAFGDCSNKYLIVGNAATIRLSLVISPVSLLLGTLKSTRTKTVFPATSISLIVFLSIFIIPPWLNYIIYNHCFQLISYYIMR